MTDAVVGRRHRPERDDFSSNRHLALAYWWSMIPKTGIPFSGSCSCIRFRIPFDLVEEPRRELPHLDLAARRRLLDEEIPPRPDDGVLERRSQHARRDQVVHQGLATERDALPVDCRLNHLL